LHRYTAAVVRAQAAESELGNDVNGEGEDGVVNKASLLHVLIAQCTDDFGGAGQIAAQMGILCAPLIDQPWHGLYTLYPVDP
jgi:hypothetical protein